MQVGSTGITFSTRKGASLEITRTTPGREFCRVESKVAGMFRKNFCIRGSYLHCSIPLAMTPPLGSLEPDRNEIFPNILWDSVDQKLMKLSTGSSLATSMTSRPTSSHISSDLRWPPVTITAVVAPVFRSITLIELSGLHVNGAAVVQ